MTIEESDNPGGTFQFKSDTAISIQVSFKKCKFGLGFSRMLNQSCQRSGNDQGIKSICSSSNISNKKDHV